MRTDELIVFLGPSLPASAAGGFTVWPPARQGDVWRALARQPRAIALIDGVFESQPSVWHHELLDALESGVAVFGAASMGALRAAELDRYGMIGVGTIYGWYRDGALVDDAEVALLHAGPEHGHRPLTLPLVNVRHAAALATRAQVLTPARSRALVEAAAALHYQERSWTGVLEAVGWPAAVRARWDGWAATGLEDLKARDARECLEVCAGFVRSQAVAPKRPGLARPSSAVRRRKLDGRPAVRDALRAIAADDRDAALRALCLAELARRAGLVPGPRRLAEAEQRWLRRAGVGTKGRAALLVARGMDEADAGRLIEVLALEQMVLEAPEALFPDGPSEIEAAALAMRTAPTSGRSRAGVRLPVARRPRSR